MIGTSADSDIFLAGAGWQGMNPPGGWLPGRDELRELALAQRTATEAGLAALHDASERLRIGPAAVERVRADYEEHLHVLADPRTRAADPQLAGERAEHDDYRRLRAALLADKRAAVVRLRDAREIDDIVLRRVQSQLDAEEVRLAGPVPDTD